MRIIRKENEEATYQYVSAGAVITKTISYWDRASFFIDEPVSDDMANELDRALNEVKNSFDDHLFSADGKKHSFFYSHFHLTEDNHLGFSIILSIDDEGIDVATAQQILDEVARKYESTIQALLDQLNN